MSYFGITDTGKVRKLNQDMYMTRELKGASLFVVCDGMGGANAGEVASEIACTAFVAGVEKALGADVSEKALRSVLSASVTAAGEAVCDGAEEHPEREGMGTTLVAAVVTDDGLAVLANVGDSRAYHIVSGGDIRRVTRDHSVVEDLVARGDLTPEQARTHPRRNLITRALGTIRGELPDLFSVRMRKDDVLLLCSDGLSGQVRDEELRDVIRSAPNAESACRELLQLTLNRGAPDNVTLIIYVFDNGRAE